MLKGSIELGKVTDRKDKIQHARLFKLATFINKQVGVD
jgi:hypothetical protein